MNLNSDIRSYLPIVLIFILCANTVLGNLRPFYKCYLAHIIFLQVFDPGIDTLFKRYIRISYTSENSNSDHYTKCLVTGNKIEIYDLFHNEKELEGIVPILTLNRFIVMIVSKTILITVCFSNYGRGTCRT